MYFRVFFSLKDIVAVGLPIQSWLERKGINSKNWDWLFVDIALAIYLLVAIGIGTYKAGLSMYVTTFLALLIMLGAVLTIQYSFCAHDTRKKETDRFINFARVALVTICILVGIIISSTPSHKWVIFEWPCRQEEWAYEAAKEATNKAEMEAYRTGDYRKFSFLDAQSEHALESLLLCEGMSE